MILLQWIVLVIALSLITIVVVSYLREHRQKPILHQEARKAPTQVKLDIEQEQTPNFFVIPKANEGSSPKYAIIDVQTTGLNTTEGEEDRIVEITWIILDERYHEISRSIHRVRQVTAGAPDAKRVHHITEIELERTGKKEREVLIDFWKALEPIPVWVFHNAHFDLSIIRGTIRRHFPEWEEELSAKVALCTMVYLTSNNKSEKTPSYLSLSNLTAYLYDIPASSIPRVPIVSLRNAYLTRACLIKLTEKYPDLLPQNYPMSVSEHLRRQTIATDTLDRT